MINYPSSINSSRNEVAQNEFFFVFFSGSCHERMTQRLIRIDIYTYCIYKICHFKMQYIC